MDQALRLREMAARTRVDEPPRVGSAAGGGKILAVTSGKGGVGKTNFTINFGLALAALGKKVAILDADLGCANVNVALGMAVRSTLSDVVRGSRRLADILVEGPGGLLVAPGGSGTQELANLDDAGRERLLAGLGELAERCDVLLIDTAAGISRNVLGFAMAADAVIVVTVPEPPAIADAYGMIKLLLTTRRNTDVRLVVNRALRSSEGKAVFEKLNLVVQRFLAGELRMMGQIPEDEAVPACVRLQKPFFLQAPRAAVSAALTRLAGDFVGEGAPAGGGVAAFLERLIRWFR